MPTPTHIRSAARRALAAVVVLVLAGCASLTTHPPTDVAPAEPEVARAPNREADLPPDSGAAAPSAATAVRPPAPHQIVVLFEAGTPGYADVAAQIAELLPSDRYRVELQDIQGANTAEVVAGLRSRRKLVAVAVGLEAVAFARAHLRDSPIVFCQVFNYQELLAGGGSIWGVHSMPPLTLQLRSWKAIDPSLRRIGLIVSEAQVGLVDQAMAAVGQAAEISYEVSSSDRETLYVFKRLAPQVDGLWLFPDNRILSPAVLQELLGYALSHGVGVLVFNEALLPWGALMSASSTAADVARSVRSVLERVVAGRAQDLPAMTPLSEVQLHVNAHAASQLGVTGVPQTPWVLREPD